MGGDVGLWQARGGFAVGEKKNPPGRRGGRIFAYATVGVKPGGLEGAVARGDAAARSGPWSGAA